MRMIQIQENMAEQKNIKDKLENEQEKLHVEYNKVKQTTCILFRSNEEELFMFFRYEISHIMVM